MGRKEQRDEKKRVENEGGNGKMENDRKGKG